MSLALHQTWLLITTVILTVCSILLLLFRCYLPWVSNYNVSFLSLFGIEPHQESWIQYLFSWIIGSGMATVTLTLGVNINESLLLLAGLHGIPFDSGVALLAVSSVFLSIFLIFAALIPILNMPLAPPSALGVLILLQLFGIPYDFVYLPSLISVFVYFAAMALGFVGSLLSLYLLIRTYLVIPLLQRYRLRRESLTLTTKPQTSTSRLWKKEKRTIPRNTLADEIVPVLYA